MPGVGDVKDVAELEGKAPAGHSLVSGGVVVEQGPDIKAIEVSRVKEYVGFTCINLTPHLFWFVGFTRPARFKLRSFTLTFRRKGFATRYFPLPASGGKFHIEVSIILLCKIIFNWKSSTVLVGTRNCKDRIQIGGATI